MHIKHSCGLRAAFFAAALTLLCAPQQALAVQNLATLGNQSIDALDLKATFPPGTIGATSARSFTDRAQANRIIDTLLMIKLAHGDDSKLLKPSEVEQRYQRYIREKTTLDLALELIALRVSNDIKPDAPLIQKRAKEIYDALPESFNIPEKATVAHILLRAGKRPILESATLADRLTKLARTTGDWAALVKANSDDAASVDDEGKIGEFMNAKGSDHPMIQAAFRSNVEKDIAEPVLSRSGIHVVKVLSRTPGRKATFEEAKAQIVDQIVREQILIKQNEYMASLRGKNEVKYNDAEIEKLIEKSDPKIREQLDMYYEAVRAADEKKKK